MSDVTLSMLSPWPDWRKIIFRFFFIYLTIQLAPWTWLNAIPGIGYTTGFYYNIDGWIVNVATKYFFYIKDVLVALGGSGDTSYGWAQLCTYLLLAFVGCVI